VGTTNARLRALTTLATFAALAGATLAAGLPAAGSAVDELLEAECPSQAPMQLSEPASRILRSAKRHRFAIVGLPAVKLRPPIAWRTRDPYRSIPWRRQLHTLSWLDPLIAAYHLRGDRRALAIARRIALDWIASYPSRNPKPSRFAWEDKRAGDRLLRIGYIARLSACSGLLSRRQARRLLRAVKQHARFLAASRTPPGRTNHQLARDLSLNLSGALFPFLKGAQKWRELGAARFEAGVAELVDIPTAVELEHSPSYQALVERMIDDYLRHRAGAPDWLRELQARMREVAWWLTMPNGQLWPGGDTVRGKPAPDYVPGPPEDAGLAPTLSAGFGIVKGSDSYFATTAAFHRRSHKQRDDLGFELFWAGRPVISDSGRNGVAPSNRAAARFPDSALAHSTITLGARWHGPSLAGKPYGTALTAQGERDGWYAIEGRHLGLARAGIDYDRLFIYRPGELLVIRDRIEAASPLLFSRWLQIAPRLDPKRKGRAFVLRDGRKAKATIWDRKGAGIRPPLLHRGERRPLRGWYVSRSAGRSLRPRWALELPARAARGTYLTTITLGPEPTIARPVGDAIRLCLPDGEIVTVAATRDGERLELEAARADEGAECR
jgi:hypothetical protein